MDTLSSAGAGAPDEAVALLALDLTPGVGPVGVRALVSRFGSARAALEQPPAVFRSSCGGRAPPDPERRRRAAQSVDEARRAGMSVVTWADRAYPAALHHLHDPPPVLFLRGRLGLMLRRSVTVVGSRRATARGRDVAERLGRALGGAGVSVTSGLALGIDGAAHRGALAAEGATIAVLGRGADEPYPPSHRRLFHQIVERGLVLTEFPPGTPPLPHHFPRRNRILAALSEATVVVEAGERSGALITVDHALDLGREVWAVPGPIDLVSCRGSNRLLVDGARPLLDLPEFLGEVSGKPSGPPPQVGGVEGRLLAALAEAPRGVDDLAPLVGLPTPQLLSLLTRLELMGAVRRLPGMRFGVAA